jgi:hypothetical protein
MKTSKLNNTMLFPEIIDSLRDNNPFTYLANSKELERYFEVLISLYPITDPRLLSTTRKLKDSIDNLWRNNGAKYTVEYLKEANRLVQFFVAGNPQSSSSDLRIGAPGGLPIIIPANHRDLIRNNNDHRDFPNVIRVIFALLGCYRLIRYEGTLKLETITDKSESKGISPWELGYNISLKFQPLFERTKVKEYSYNLLSLVTAGPNNRISLLSAPIDALALRGSEVTSGLKVLSDYFKIGVYHLLEKEWEVLSDIASKGTELLGKLAVKDEAAGKRRVFAIVDIWTQSALKPMHDHIFSILKLIKEDGAFDQIKPVKALIARNKNGKTFCFDLSAATDRFPISVQVDVLSHLYNREVAMAWKQVLVSRPYYLKETNTSYTYGAGQPMGALSSWGVFSLCHHVIVQIAATRVGNRKWFTEYALLGDDIVITDPLVADEYYNIMTKELCVSINKSKSLQSEQGVMEFAKRIIGPKGDFSPVGPKNVSLFLANKLHIPSLLVDLREKGIGIDYFFVRKFLTTLKSKQLFRFNWSEIHALIWSLTEPFGFLKSYTLTPWKWRKTLGNMEAVESLEKLLAFMKEEWSLNKDKALETCKDCIDKYDGFMPINSHFVDVNILPSIVEQKLKLMEEYARLSNLVYPKIDFRIERPRMKSSMSMLFDMDDSAFATPSAPQLILYIYEDDGRKVKLSMSFDMLKPDFMLGQILKYLSESLPPIIPMTSVFADININRRSLRHVSFRFLKKFLNWKHT